MTKISVTLVCLLPLCAQASSTDITLQDCSSLESYHPVDSKIYIKCLDSNINMMRRHQQSWINKLLHDIEQVQTQTGNTQLMPIIKRSIVYHEQYSDDTCKWRYLYTLPNSIKASVAYKKCTLHMLHRHIEDLQQPY
ncbi:hypothetical protein PSECIP111951_01678 [Pseudoalteromonas holothuriae]|uniref:DUF1311 domain-containing protein n=1 Tax=Pseudoalteromonas holothuriae TaxID=2963714 RepID=A0A9W4QT29_9GAMM|nr:MULTISPECIES: hypothetical protein [unclassified Pseudoalteromonas]CAH9051942.1 hypothetical protein PSECIP111854_00867 [Pseudoalteromonas sp. CIP111854]CAH9057485.1 hypothetical protein PSECIP111951_01678 [Pseudoalteromonas sp. CIP111951]